MVTVVGKSTELLNATFEAYCGFLETMPDAALLVEKGGRIACANQVAVRLFSGAGGRLKVRNVQELIPVPLRGTHRLHMQHFWANPISRPMANRDHLEALRGDGTLIPVAIMLNHVGLLDGEYVVVVCRDMTKEQEQDKELRAALAREKNLAMTDALTGAANLRQFKEQLRNEIERCDRHGREFSLAYMDLDYFKLVNDNWGHEQGDKLLCQIVEVARGRLRKTDTVARVGGDEFAVILPDTDFVTMASPVNDLLDTMRRCMQEGGWPVTISCGVVTFRTPPNDVDDAIKAVDRLMYQAKKSGKNSSRKAVFDLGSLVTPDNSGASV